MKNKKDFFKGALCGALAILLVTGTASCGKVLLGKADVLDKEARSKIGALETLVDTYYKDDVKLDDMKDGLYKGYISGLGDPYSQYFNKEETKKLNESISGEFGGIGAILREDPDTGYVQVVKVYKDSPAETAGIKAEDYIYKVDGKDMGGKDISEVVSHVRGEKGTEVKLTMIRGSEGKEIETTAVRDIIKAETVSSNMMQDQIGYISITEFDEVTADQYEKALKELEDQGMKGLIVDVRNNPGGNLEIVRQICDQMLPKGTIVSTKDKNGKEEVLTSDGEHQFKKPLVVLVNGMSASASEIFSGAIQDYGTGTLVGEKTFGKGIVQQIFSLKDGSSVKITVSEYFTPKGRSIHGKGIKPDVEIPLEWDENEEIPDNQLRKAVEILKEKI